MRKTLVVLGILCMAAVAIADVTMDFTATKDAGIDASYGEHCNRGGGTQFRFAKGIINSGEVAIYDFDRAAVQTFVNANLGGMTLQDAINQGNIKVSFSLVTSVSLGDFDPNWQVGVQGIYTADQWVEGDGGAGSVGDDASYNWTGAYAAPFPTAVTLDAPADQLGLAGGAGGGNWTDSSTGWIGQQLKSITGLSNGTIMTGWAQDTRTAVQLDDGLWAAFIFGVNANDTSVATPAMGMLNTYGFSWGATDPTYGNAPNACVYSREAGAANAPMLTVTIVGVSAVKHPGDANNDGAVDVVDLGILARNYDGTGKAWAEADFNADGVVDVVDLGILARNYDWVGAPAGAVPEPATLAMLAFGGVAALIRRRK